MNANALHGATPIEPEEARALIASHVTTRAELNGWEHANLVEGERWAFSRRRKELLSEGFLHRNGYQ